jgi:hypothetical protein
MRVSNDFWASSYSLRRLTTLTGRNTFLINNISLRLLTWTPDAATVNRDDEKVHLAVKLLVSTGFGVCFPLRLPLSTR